jgi:two-component system, OmpR family, sensor histidine kinase KdpD
MPAKTIDFTALGPMVFGERDSSLLQALATRPREESALPSRSLWWRTIVHWLIGPLTILALTAFLRSDPSVNVTTAGFAFLLAILVASTFLEFRFAVLMCITAALAYDYFFLPPTGHFNINDPQDWVALFAFLTTALIGTKLSAASRSKAQEATRRRLEVERLYSLSQRLLGNEDPATLLKSIPQLIAESLGIESAALYIHETEKTFRSSSKAEALSDADMRNACYLPHPEVSTKGNISLVPVRLGEAIYGSLAFFGPYFSRETVDAAASLVAVAVARARALEEVAKVEAARESERLKSVLLDAITHDFRTPLASIKICATGLLEDLDFDRAQRKDLLAVIDEECDRISKLVGWNAARSSWTSARIRSAT